MISENSTQKRERKTSFNDYFYDFHDRLFVTVLKSGRKRLKVKEEERDLWNVVGNWFLDGKIDDFDEIYGFLMDSMDVYLKIFKSTRFVKKLISFWDFKLEILWIKHD